MQVLGACWWVIEMGYMYGAVGAFSGTHGWSMWGAGVGIWEHLGCLPCAGVRMVCGGGGVWCAGVEGW